MPRHSEGLWQELVWKPKRKWEQFDMTIGVTFSDELFNNDYVAGQYLYLASLFKSYQYCRYCPFILSQIYILRCAYGN